MQELSCDRVLKDALIINRQNLLARFHFLKSHGALSIGKKLTIGFFVLFLLQRCEKKDTPLFTRLAPINSGIDFENTIVETPEINILTYEYTYNGGGVAAGDFNNDGLCDLFFTGNTVSNRLYLNQGGLRFKDITVTAMVGGRKKWKTGVTLADVNSDGWLDIYVCYSGPDSSQSLSNELYINNKSEGEPTFTEQAGLYGLDAPGTFSTQASFFDYDRDGDLDMFLINHGNHFYSPFINTNKLRNTRHPNFGNRLYRNDSLPSSVSAGKESQPYFTEVSQAAGIHGGGINFSLGVSVSDVNEDGWPDIYVSNDYEEQDYLYLNNKNGTFTDCTKASFGHLSRNGMGTDIADYNNDGRPDLIEVDMWPEDNFRQKLLKGPDDYNRYRLMIDSGFHHQQMRNTLQLNRGVDQAGIPIFSEIGQLAGVSATDWSWAPLFADFDNDGNKDLFVTNGYLRDFTSMDFLKYTVEEEKKAAIGRGEVLSLFKLISKMSSTKTSDYIFKNNGDVTFSNVTKEWGIFLPNLSFGAAYADLDNDGDLEIITNNTNETATVWNNHASEKKLGNHIKVKLKDMPHNPFGIGAKVFLESEGRSQLQEIYLSRGFQSSVEPIAHFGLGNVNPTKIKVVWPDGKQSEIETGLNYNLVEVSYRSATSAKPDLSVRPVTFLQDVTKESGIDFIHHENSFVDFDREPLLPYQLSRHGPALAVGDVDADGRDDFFVGGAAGQKSVLYIGQGDGKFKRGVSQPWEIDFAKEDVGATFFDVEGDGDLDLFVVSGGNEFENGSSDLDDRLYINLGNRKFVKALANATPPDHINGSCVAAADFDRDGDIDLFVGGRNRNSNFPLSAPSAILRNESSKANNLIKLELATKEVNPALREVGMVTDAIWTDFNNDQWPDLLIVGEWMSIRLFENRKGKLVEVIDGSLQAAKGLWNRVVGSDLDDDGDLDYVIGNAGTNLPFRASLEDPLVMYYGDFNNDGRIDPIICQSIDGKHYPIASRDELLQQMSSLKKKYQSYASYANATIEDVIGKEMVQEASRVEVNMLESIVLENIGKGKFKTHLLPLSAQFSSARGFIVKDFNKDGRKDILLSGNFYPYKTQIGASDAGIGTCLLGVDKMEYKAIEIEICEANKDVRNMILLREGTILMTVNNGSSVLFNVP